MAQGWICASHNRRNYEVLYLTGHSKFTYYAGGLLNAVQTTMYALAAHVYPTRIRSTGVGTSVAVGRIGNVVASYVGAFALDTGGAPAFFSTWAMSMAVVLGSLALVRRHIGRPARHFGVARATPQV